MRRFLIIFVFVLFCKVVRAQNIVEAGIQFSAVSYFGDIEEYDYLKSVSPGVGIFGRWNLNTRMALRGQFVFGKLKADGKLSKAYIGQTGTGGSVFPRVESQAFNFNKSFQLFEVLYEYNFNDYMLGSSVAPFTPYITFGGGMYYSQAGEGGSFIIEPVVDNVLGGVDYYRPYEPEPGKRTDQFNTLSPVIPFGMGIKWNISDKLALNVEALMRKTFTDNIDNLVDPKRFQDFDASGGGAQNFYRDSFANSEIHNNDWFSTISVSFSYLIWNGECKCPVLE